MKDTEKSKEFEKFLESIGGLENGFYSDRPPIKDRGFFCVDDGWLPLLLRTIEQCIAAGWDRQVCQVKEKFGGLRFYINSASDEVYDIISQAERESYGLCERCGEPGELRNDIGWYMTLCEHHYIEQKEVIKKRNEKHAGN